MNLDYNKLLKTIYTLNLNGYLNRNPQLLDAIEWNRKLFNIIILDESNHNVKNIISKDEIFIWLKDNIGWPQACDYLRIKLISEFDYECFIDMDIILMDAKLAEYGNYIARYDSTNHLNCDIIKGKSLAKILYKWFLTNYKKYEVDFMLTYDLISNIHINNYIDYCCLFNLSCQEREQHKIGIYKAKSIEEYLKYSPKNGLYMYLKEIE